MAVTFRDAIRALFSLQEEQRYLSLPPAPIDVSTEDLERRVATLERRYKTLDKAVEAIFDKVFPSTEDNL